MEDYLSGRWSQWKMISVGDEWETAAVGDNLSGRQPRWKRISVDRISLESEKSETILKRWKTASMEENLNISSASTVNLTLAWDWHQLSRRLFSYILDYCDEKLNLDGKDELWNSYFFLIMKFIFYLGEILYIFIRFNIFLAQAPQGPYWREALRSCWLSSKPHQALHSFQWKEVRECQS